MSRLASPITPFLILRGLDQICVRDLEHEYQELFATTQNVVQQQRAQFMSSLYPLVLPAFAQSDEERASVKRRVRTMVEQKFV